MNFPLLFSPLQVGPYRLNHRIVMAPLTRMRAEKESFAPRPLNAEYYSQRATPGGLIIAEASPVMSTGRGNAGTPGIYSDQQIEGWREVVNAVHEKGGVIMRSRRRFADFLAHNTVARLASEDALQPLVSREPTMNAPQDAGAAPPQKMHNGCRPSRSRRLRLFFPRLASFKPHSGLFEADGIFRHEVVLRQAEMVQLSSHHLWVGVAVYPADRYRVVPHRFD